MQISNDTDDTLSILIEYKVDSVYVKHDSME